MVLCQLTNHKDNVGRRMNTHRDPNPKVCHSLTFDERIAVYSVLRLSELETGSGECDHDDPTFLKPNKLYFPSHIQD